MVAQPRSDLRDVLAGVLILLLSLTGGGNAISSGPADLRFAASGVVVPICHSGRQTSGPADPDQPIDPGCCTACVLLAAAVLPAAPELSRPAPVPGPALRIVALAPPPDGTPIRSPRQARAPPFG